MSLDKDQLPTSAQPGPSEAAPPVGAAGTEPVTPPPHNQLRALAVVHEELVRLEETLCGGHRPITGSATRIGHATATGVSRTRDAAGHVHVPAWLRVTHGESRWPVAVAMVVAIGLQLACPTTWCCCRGGCCPASSSRC